MKHWTLIDTPAIMGLPPETQIPGKMPMWKFNADLGLQPARAAITGYCIGLCHTCKLLSLKHGRLSSCT
jgi:hypothetical protein